MSSNVKRKKLIHDIVLTNDRFMSSHGTPTMTITVRAPPHHSAATVDSRGSGSVLGRDLLYSLSGFMVGLG